jgi:ankyrin repeat protein
MSDSLPERPNLDQLRRQAKELRDAARRGDTSALTRFARHHPSPGLETASLAAAQLVIARELGFPSWPRLKATIEADVIDRRQRARFVTASVEGRLREAADVMSSDPDIAGRDIRVAAILGDANRVHDMLAVDPGAAVAIDDDQGWPPLLYACYSRWHHVEPQRASDIAAVVRQLLDAGASPNTNDGGRPRYRSALKGSVEVNNPHVTEALLDAGANPDAGQPIVEAVGRGDHQCLQLLLSRGARIAGTWALGAAVYNDDPVALKLLLDALEVSGVTAVDAVTGLLPETAANASLLVVQSLLDAGADPNGTDENGLSALRIAVREGKNDIATRLKAAGATDDRTDVDQFIGACLNGDRAAAESLLHEHPDLRERLTDDDRAAIVDAATRSVETVRLMLDLGFSPHARKHGEEPLHIAAYSGNTPVVRVLLDAGAEVDCRDDRFEGTPLAFATVGSGEQAGKPGDWVGTVRLLVEAGAARQGVWVSEKPPSEEVMDVLRSYGIGPNEPPVQPPAGEAEEEPEERRPIGTGTMADLARHLEAAYSDRDLDLLGSLLHPEVHWSGLCTNSVEVLDWYRALLAEGMFATVRTVEVDRDAVILGLEVAHQAVGARPVRPQKLHQVFTVEDAQVVEIRFYPDRSSALNRP